MPLQRPAGLAGMRVGLAICILTLLAYQPVLTGGFAAWYAEDLPLGDEPLLESWSGLWGIWAGELPAGDSHYRPAAYSVFWVAYQLWGRAEAGYHLLCLGIHLACAFLAAGNLRSLRVPGAAWFAFIFALHPIAVQTVAWVVNLKVLVSSLFYLAAIRAAIAFRATQSPRLGMLVLVCVALACLAKTSAVSIPVSLALLWVALRTRPTRREWILLGASTVVAAGIGALDWHFVASEGDLSPVPFPLDERLVLTGISLLRYLRNALVPFPLLINYSFDLSVSDVVVGVGVVAVVATLFVLGHTRMAKLLLLLVVGFAVTLAPHWVTLTDTWRATPAHDRYQYLATPLLWAAIAAGLVGRARSSIGAARWASLGAIAAISIAMPLLTWRQATLYAGDTALFERELEKYPNGRATLIDLLPLYEESEDWERVAFVSQRLLDTETWQDRLVFPRSSAFRSLIHALLETRRDREAVEALRRGLREYEAEQILSSTRISRLAELTLESRDGAVRDPAVGAMLVAALQRDRDALPPDEAFEATVLSASAAASDGRFDDAVRILEQLGVGSGSGQDDASRAGLEARLGAYRRGTLYLH